MKEKRLTYKEVVEANREFFEWIQLERHNIHNKLGEPERQESESLADYKRRLKLKQIQIGYSDSDWIIV